MGVTLFLIILLEHIFFVWLDLVIAEIFQLVTVEVFVQFFFDIEVEIESTYILVNGVGNLRFFSSSFAFVLRYQIVETRRHLRRSHRIVLRSLQ